MAAQEFYWCLDHSRVEPSSNRCKADNRLGPYPTPEAAENWSETVEERNKKWKDEDERWEGLPQD
ncbi:MAG: hypothetical protein ACI867_001816 [Glaciecola sp.]|jgi:hypothetical protein